MITKEELNQLVALTKAASPIEDKIGRHITKALKAICEIYGGKLHWWDYYADGIEEGGAGGSLNANDDIINIYVEIKPPLEEEPLVCGDNICCNFPVEFLFKSIDEIKEIVSQEKLKNAMDLLV